MTVGAPSVIPIKTEALQGGPPPYPLMVCPVRRYGGERNHVPGRLGVFREGLMKARPGLSVRRDGAAEV